MGDTLVNLQIARRTSSGCASRLLVVFWTRKCYQMLPMKFSNSPILIYNRVKKHRNCWAMLRVMFVIEQGYRVNYGPPSAVYIWPIYITLITWVCTAVYHSVYSYHLCNMEINVIYISLCIYFKITFDGYCTRLQIMLDEWEMQ